MSALCRRARRSLLWAGDRALIVTVVHRASKKKKEGNQSLYFDLDSLFFRAPYFFFPKRARIARQKERGRVFFLLLCPPQNPSVPCWRLLFTWCCLFKKKLRSTYTARRKPAAKRKSLTIPRRVPFWHWRRQLLSICDWSVYRRYVWRAPGWLRARHKKCPSFSSFFFIIHRYFINSVICRVVVHSTP